MKKSAIDQLSKIIAERRSIFPPMFTGEKVEDNCIDRLLENANYAPTHRRTEPWRFIVFSGKSRRLLSEYSSEWYRRNTPAEQFSELKYQKTKQKALLSSHVIAIVMERHDGVVPEWEEIASVACAVQNMWLSATALGLGAYWSSPKYAIQGNEFFGLTENQKCLGLFYIGIPVKSLPPVIPKAPISLKIKWNK